MAVYVCFIGQVNVVKLNIKSDGELGWSIAKTVTNKWSSLTVLAKVFMFK